MAMRNLFIDASENKDPISNNTIETLSTSCILY